MCKVELSQSCQLSQAGSTFARACYDEISTATRTLLRIKETTQLAFSPFIDAGSLIAANIMRPIGEGTQFGISYEQFGSEWKPVYRGNLLFVLRNLVAAVLGLVTDLARTWGAALMWLTTAAGGAIILLIGIGLLSWGGGRWRSPSSQR